MLELLKKGALMIFLMSAIMPSYAGGMAEKKIILENDVVKAAFDRKSGALLHLENKALKATIDSRDGSLTSLKSKDTGWDILKDSNAGRSFEASLKLPDGRFFVIDAISQDNPEIEVSENQLSFTWRGLKAEGQKLDIDFTGTIRITNDGLIYGGTIANNSAAVVEQLCWPFIGEVTIPEDTQQMLFQYMTYTSFGTEELYPTFRGRGWSNLPELAFTLLHNKKQGLYLSSMDHEFLEYIRCEHETIPKEDFATFAGQAGSKTNNEERLHMRTRVRAARMLYLQSGGRHKILGVHQKSLFPKEHIQFKKEQDISTWVLSEYSSPKLSIIPRLRTCLHTRMPPRADQRHQGPSRAFQNRTRTYSQTESSRGSWSS